MTIDPSSVPGRLSAEGARHEAERETGAFTPAGREVTRQAKAAAGFVERSDAFDRFVRDNQGLIAKLDPQTRQSALARDLSEQDFWQIIDQSGVPLDHRERAMKIGSELGLTGELARDW